MQSDWLKDFGLNLKNKIFPKYRVCAGTQKINIFIVEHV